MKFKIDKKTLEAAYSLLVRLAAHSSMRLVKAVLRKNVLRLEATDMMATLRLDVPCESEDEGEFILDGPFFLPVLKELPVGMITMSVGERSVNVDWEIGSCQFPVATDAAFPPLPRIGRDTDHPIRLLVLQCDDIRGIVSGVLPATADKEAELRPVLGGAFFDVDGEGVTVVGTDGQMLLKRGIAIRTAQDEPFSFLVPKMAIMLLASVLPEEEESVTVCCDGRVFQCSGEGYKLTSLCIDQRFPAYRTIIPSGDGGRLTVDRKALHAAVRRVAALTSAKDGKDTVTFSLAGGMMPSVELQAQNLLDFSSVKERLECGWDGGELLVGFNVQRLLAMLCSTEAERVTLVITDPARPVLFLPENAESSSGVLMPVPVREFVETTARVRKKS